MRGTLHSGWSRRVPPCAGFGGPGFEVEAIGSQKAGGSSKSSEKFCKNFVDFRPDVFKNPNAVTTVLPYCPT